VCAGTARKLRGSIRKYWTAARAVETFLFSMNISRQLPYLLGIASLASAPTVFAQAALRSNEEFSKYAMKLREAAISSLEPRVSTPTAHNTYAWRTGIITTTFWVGENASTNNPVHNRSSSWDANWAVNFGGFDNPDPAARTSDFRPKAFIPKQNPFYIALPYNDVTRGTTKPESRQVIPWFKREFQKEGQSVCRDRWVAVRNARNGRTAYAQWSDCGPFRTDHFEYVFGDKRPSPNLNGGAGLDVSPAVRDYLGINSTDVTDWRFVELRDVAAGPWQTYGDNNHFVQRKRAAAQSVVSNAAPKSAAEPNVVTKTR
jgi:hypothetical protein